MSDHDKKLADLLNRQDEKIKNLEKKLKGLKAEYDEKYKVQEWMKLSEKVEELDKELSAEKDFVKLLKEKVMNRSTYSVSEAAELERRLDKANALAMQNGCDRNKAEFKLAIAVEALKKCMEYHNDFCPATDGIPGDCECHHDIAQDTLKQIKGDV